MPNKKNGKSSMDYYRENPETYEKRKRDQKEINKRPAERKRRAELVKLNREAQKEGRGKVGDKKDVSHQKNGKTKMEDQSKNRGSKSNTAGDRRARGGKK